MYDRSIELVYYFLTNKQSGTYMVEIPIEFGIECLGRDMPRPADANSANAHNLSLISTMSAVDCGHSNIAAIVPDGQIIDKRHLSTCEIAVGVLILE